MGFIGVYRALYDYVPQAEGELAIEESDLLYVLEQNEDDGWWKAKKKAGTEDEEEPIGLVPGNYIEQIPAASHARALYEYTRQTDEELSFPEDALLEVYDTSDPDWILVGLDNEYGFVPSNYIDLDGATADDQPAEEPAPPTPPALPVRPPSIQSPPEPQSPALSSPTSPTEPTGPAAALAGVMGGRAPPSQPESLASPTEPLRPTSQYDDYHHASDEEPVRSPTLPSRPRPQAEPQHSPREAPYSPREQPIEDTHDRTPGNFHMYNINEMVSIMGKRKKMATTLGINLRTGMILIAPEYASDGPSQEWTADKMTHYSREGKHVFMELVRPSKSIDFHAGAKDTAEEIVSALGEMAGAVRSEGLREVVMAGTNQSMKKGQILYDFMAQGDDEVSVSAGEEVIVVDDSKSDEWWQVRRIKNGKEGVVPSSYIEITGTFSPRPGGSEYESIKSTIEQNRADEMRLTKEALKASKEPQVGPGMPLPTRGSSLRANKNSSNSREQGKRRENGNTSRAKPKPDSSKVRTWTDRSKSFSVDAQFLGLKDGKIHLHKMNGVKIAVPISKMSKQDIEYVESMTGISLQDDKPIGDPRKSRSIDAVNRKKGPEHDWFQFFLECDVAVGLCERYSQAFYKDSMDESVLSDVNDKVLRTLGLREGDIIKVMRHLDAKYGRTRAKDGDGGLFSGPGGALRNNTRKGRPAPAVQTSDVVDASAFSTKKEKPTSDAESSAPTSPTKAQANDSNKASSGGFDDDAWSVKPSKQPAPAQAQSPPAAAVSSPPPTLTGGLADLSLLSEPLQPTKTAPVPPQLQLQPQPTNTSPPQIAQPAQPVHPGANLAFFSSLAPLQSAATGQISSQGGLRQRPLPPQATGLQGSLAPPPPQRPLSAPLSAQPSQFAAPGLLPQMTGAQVAPPGQSLHEISQARLQQQQQQQLQQQHFLAQMQQPMITGYQGGNPAQFMQPMITGAPGQSPFADANRTNSFPLQAQPTGFQPQSQFGTQQNFGQPQGGINSYLPPALTPEKTGIQPQQGGFGGMMSQPTGFGMQTGQAAQPLVPQQTGPAPPVRFGVTAEAKKLAPQPTGRANLSKATPNNPFGF